jgi:hypothetical protein
MPKPGNPHKLFTVAPEGDYWQAHCLGCPWESELLDTKAEARKAHVDHNTDWYLGKLSPQSPPEGSLSPAPASGP